MKHRVLAHPSHPAHRPTHWALAAIAALALGAFLPASPAAAATSDHATWCLTSDSQADCGFSSLAQCEATAAGGLGSCSMVPGMAAEQDGFRRAHAQMRLPRH